LVRTDFEASAREQRAELPQSIRFERKTEGFLHCIVHCGLQVQPAPGGRVSENEMRRKLAAIPVGMTWIV